MKWVVVGTLLVAIISLLVGEAANQEANHPDDGSYRHRLWPFRISLTLFLVTGSLAVGWAHVHWLVWVGIAIGALFSAGNLFVYAGCNAAMRRAVEHDRETRGPSLHE